MEVTYLFLCCVMVCLKVPTAPVSKRHRQMLLDHVNAPMAPARPCKGPVLQPCFRDGLLGGTVLQSLPTVTYMPGPILGWPCSFP